jgi:hypothetical protein
LKEQQREARGDLMSVRMGRRRRTQVNIRADGFVSSRIVGGLSCRKPLGVLMRNGDDWTGRSREVRERRHFGGRGTTVGLHGISRTCYGGQNGPERKGKKTRVKRNSIGPSTDWYAVVHIRNEGLL